MGKDRSASQSDGTEACAASVLASRRVRAVIQEWAFWASPKAPSHRSTKGPNRLLPPLLPLPLAHMGLGHCFPGAGGRACPKWRPRLMDELAKVLLALVSEPSMLVRQVPWRPVLVLAGVVALAVALGGTDTRTVSRSLLQAVHLSRAPGPCSSSLTAYCRYTLSPVPRPYPFIPVLDARTNCRAPRLPHLPISSLGGVGNLGLGFPESDPPGPRRGRCPILCQLLAGEVQTQQSHRTARDSQCS